MELIKTLNLSGGSLKIAGHLGVCETLLKTYKPNVLSGTSAGALMCLLIPNVDWDDINDPNLKLYKNTILNITPDYIWNLKPVNKNGSITIPAAFRVITGASSLGDMSNLEYTIKSLISPDMFYKNFSNSKYKHIFINTVSFNTGAREVFDITKLSYENAIRVVIASSSIPVFAQPVESINTPKEYFYDGGVRNHVPSTWVLNNLKNVSESVTVFTRPKDCKIIEGMWEPSNIYEVLTRTIDIMNLEISKSDEKEEKLICERDHIKLTQLFLPKVLESLYDTDNGRLLKLYNEGLKLGGIYK